MPKPPRPRTPPPETPAAQPTRPGTPDERARAREDFAASDLFEAVDARPEALPQPAPLPADKPPPFGLGAAIALALLAVAHVLPMAGQPTAAWQALVQTVEVPFPLLLQVSLALAGLAVLAFGLRAWVQAQPSAPPAQWASAPGWLVLAGLAGLLALQARQAAQQIPGWAEPLRGALYGLPPEALAATAAGGLLALAARPGLLAARAVAALGALGLWLHACLPVGWIGASRVPALAWGGVPGPLSGTGDATQVALAGGGFAFVAALLATAVLVVLALQARPARGLVLTLAGLLLALPTAWALRAGLDLALLTAGAVALAACAVAALLEDLRERGLPELGRVVEPVVVALLVGAYLVLKINALRYSTTDEAIYYYAARMWTDGLLPYRDFFFSHPPLHIAVPALLYGVFGYSFLLGKWLSALAALGVGLVVWRLARRHLGVVAGVLALGMHLLAGEVLQASTNLTGINLTTCWLMLGVWAAVQHRFLLAGLLLGAAASTGFYAAGGFLALAVLAAFLPVPPGFSRDETVVARLLRHPALQLTFGFLLVWGGLALVFWSLAGDGYVDGVYTYHFAKKAKVAGFVDLSDGLHAIPNNFAVLLGSRDFTVSIYHHASHWWWTLLAPLALAARAWLDVRVAAQAATTPDRRKTGATPGAWWHVLVWPRRWWQPGEPVGFGMLVFALTLALVVEFGQFKERYDFYYALILPLLALSSAAFFAALLHLGRAAVHALPAGTATAPTFRSSPVVAGLAVVVLLLGLLWVPVDMWANRRAYPSEFDKSGSSKGLGERLEFGWVPTPGPAWLGEVTQALFWQADRVRGSIESGVHHYLWNKKRWFSTADDIAAYVRESSKPHETLTGASDYAPLIALLSGRRMAGNHVDTNSKVFNTGAVPLETFWDKACADNVKFLIAAPMSYFAPKTLHLRASVTENFRRDRVFSDPLLKHWRLEEIEVWVRKSEGPCTYRGRRGAAPVLGGE